MWVPVLSWENALGVKLCVIFLLLIHPKGIKKKNSFPGPKLWVLRLYIYEFLIPETLALIIERIFNV